MSEDSTTESTAPEADDPTLLAEIKPAVRKRLQKCFDHARQLMGRLEYNFDYAHTLLSQCVSGDPASLIYLEELIGNLYSKYEKMKRKPAPRGGGPRGPLKKAVSAEAWPEVIKLGLEGLKDNPWDASLWRAVAQSCEAIGANETELRLLKCALHAMPKDPDVNRHCAQSLARVGQFDQAIACWHRIEELDTSYANIAEATAEIARLTVEKNVAHSGTTEKDEIETAATSRPTPTTQQQAAPSSTGSVQWGDDDAAGRETDRPIPLTPRQELERRVLDQPDVTEHYVQLADLLCDEGRLAEADQTLQRAVQVSGGDIQVREKLENVHMRRGRHQLAIAEKQAEEEQSEEATELAKSMRAEVVQQELEVYSARGERYPDDPVVQYELGARLKRMGKIDEALVALQIAAQHKSRKAVAYLDIGECQQQRKKYGKALESYRTAAEAAGEERIKVRKLALYRAGVLATGLKETEQARKFLDEVAKIDPNYRDVAARLDKLARISDKG